MVKAEQRKNAADFFINSTHNQAQVVAIFKLTEKTVARWAKEDNWHILRAARQTSANQIIGQFYNMITDIQNLATKEKRQLTTVEIGNIHKMASSIEKMNNKIHIRYYYMVADELTKYIMEVDMPTAKLVGYHIMDFLNKKAKEVRV
ncbi:hypothetical protein [Parasediminibacterium sp. JCM 36343]|uniref:hypothetical protein n=1 Tax=Parasediminibacterium sp. JCM 36343 TaxID=3374279 RepID=UPI003977F825